MATKAFSDAEYSHEQLAAAATVRHYAAATPRALAVIRYAAMPLSYFALRRYEYNRQPLLKPLRYATICR